MSEEQESYDVWLAMQDIQKMAQGYENAVDLLQKKDQEIGHLRDQCQDYKESIDKINNSIWELMYPDDPTGWEYLTQPVAHIKVEIERLRKALLEFADEDNWLFIDDSPFASPDWLGEPKPWERAKASLSEDDEENT